MKINLKATGIELTEAITNYAEKKVNALEKYINKPEGSYLARVEVARTTRHHKEGFIFKAEIHITGSGFDVYAASEAEDLYAAIDMAEAETAHELQSEKGRHRRLLRKGQRAFKNAILGIGSRFRRK
ncbi:MAG: Ribosomal subunit interface protein [Parcubacteria group bacterium]|nr:Ribosomal subunit interface protein [Parcubacteria group bacterium]